MPRVAITITNAPGRYANVGEKVTLLAADTEDDHEFASTGRELVIAYNTDAAVARTVTINSAPDPFNRTRDITDHEIPAGEIHVFGPFPTLGWRQPSGVIHLEASTDDVLFGVIRLPGGGLY